MTLAPAQQPYRICLLFTFKNSDFGADFCGGAKLSRTHLESGSSHIGLCFYGTLQRSVNRSYCYIGVFFMSTWEVIRRYIVAFFNPRAKITISFSFVIGGITIKRITWLYSNSLLFCCSIKQNCFQNHLSYQTTVMRDFTKSFVQMSIIMFIPLLSVDINIHF